MSGPKCETCYFWRQTAEKGECHKDPPMAAFPKGLFPIVGQDEWCGEHQLTNRMTKGLSTR